MSATLPSVTVIMPVRNEADFVSRSVGAVMVQDYPVGRLEIIVADGMSTDGTRRVLQELCLIAVNLRVIDNPGLVVSTGLNAAIRLATGDIVVRVDGHCIVPSDYVRQCVDWLSRSSADGVGGTIETVGETPTAVAVAMAMSSRFGVGDSAFRVGVAEPVFADTVPFPAYTKQTIEQLGPYDESLVRNQDDEYNYRLRKAGGRLLLVPTIRTRYFSRTGLAALWRQFLQYGFYKVRVLRKHPAQLRWRQLVPPLFVVSVVLLALIASFSSLATVLFLGVLFIYVFANVAWSLSLAGWTASLRVLPLAFGVMHFAYGVGFLKGCLSAALGAAGSTGASRAGRERKKSMPQEGL